MNYTERTSSRNFITTWQFKSRLAAQRHSLFCTCDECAAPINLPLFPLCGNRSCKGTCDICLEEDVYCYDEEECNDE